LYAAHKDWQLRSVFAGDDRHGGVRRYQGLDQSQAKAAWTGRTLSNIGAPAAMPRALGTAV
jgi:hypothetical protein